MAGDKDYKNLRKGADVAERAIDSRTIFRGRILNLRVDEVILPDGSKSSREVVEHPGAVVVLPVLDNGNIVLVRQYRHAAGKFMLELPAGKLDHKDEDCFECARRELLEETNYECGALDRLIEFYASPGMSDEKMTLFVARGLKSKKYDGCDEDEFIATADYPLARALEMIKENSIIDLKTIAGIFYYSVFVSASGS